MAGLLAAIGLLPAICLAAEASDADPGLPPTTGEDAEVIVVTASQTPRPIEQILGTVDVITEEAIVLRRVQEVADALRNLAGLHLDQPGGRGGRASLYLRGLDPNQTVVLIDGVRVNDPTNNRGGSFDLTTLDADAVERIEVVRGPLSAVHGSDAMAGAVNIITRGGRGPDAARLDASVGRYSDYRTVASIRGQRGPIDLSISGGWVDSGEPESQSQYQGGHANLSLGAELPWNANARAFFRYVNSELEAFPDDSGGEDFAVIRTLEERDVEELTAGLRLEQALFEWLDYSLIVSFYQRKEDRASPGIAAGVRPPFPGERSDDELERGSFITRANVDLGAGFSAALGGDVYHEQGDSDSLLVFRAEDFGFDSTLPASFELERVVGGPFAELHFKSEFGLVAEAGLRVDFTDEDIDTQVTPRVGASYRMPWIPVQLRGSWGEGFKLPSFFALGHPIVGNPNLEPEKSKGFDVGVRVWAWQERLRATLTYFEITVKDQIDFEEATALLVNRSKVVSRGFEFELLLGPHPTLDFGGHLTYTNADIRKSAEELRNRPMWRGDLSLAWRPVDVLTLNLTALFVGEVLDSSIPTGDRVLDSYTRVDFAATWQVWEHVALYLAIDNLLNEDYEEAVGFPAPGVNPRVGFDIRF